MACLSTRSPGWLPAVILLAATVPHTRVAATTGTDPLAMAPRDATTKVSGETYQKPAFDRYLPIISRMPFGVPPPPPPASMLTNGPAAAVADLAKNFVLFGIVRTPAGDVAAGFSDNAAKPPRSLLLAVGEESDGYRVLAADIDLETATLEQDGKRIELKMNSSDRAAAGNGPAGAGGAHPGPRAGQMSMAAYSSRLAHRGADAASLQQPAGAVGLSAQPVPNSVGIIDRLLNSGLQDNSYASRLRARREQLVKQSDEERANREQEALSRVQSASKDEIDKRLHETNLNLIRKGLKPIGTIQLTPEEDAKLVDEGVLPAP